MPTLKIRFGPYLLDEARYLLERGGTSVALRPKAFDLLVLLARNRERVVRREEAVVGIWGRTRVGPGSLAGLVNELRAALREPGRDSSMIRTVHGRGYQFVADARTVAADPGSGGAWTMAAASRVARAVIEEACGVGPVGVLLEADPDLAGDFPELAAWLAVSERMGVGVVRVDASGAIPMTASRLAAALAAELARTRGDDVLDSALPLPARGWMTDPVDVPVAGDPVDARFVAETVGATPRTSLPGGLFAVASAFVRCAATQPVLIVVQGVDRADPGLPTDLAHFVRGLRAAPVVLLATATAPIGLEARRALVEGAGFRSVRPRADADAGNETGVDARLRLDEWRRGWGLDALAPPVERALLAHLDADRALVLPGEAHEAARFRSADATAIVGAERVGPSRSEVSPARRSMCRVRPNRDVASERRETRR